MNKHVTEQNQTSSQVNELNEIFMAPSNEIVVERFSTVNQASSADCCGGVCRGSCSCGG